MDKPAPLNGPSKTANPSGGGRGNNPSALDDEGGYARPWPSDPAPSPPPPTPEQRVEQVANAVVRAEVERIQAGTFAEQRAALAAQREAVWAQCKGRAPRQAELAELEAIERNEAALDAKRRDDIVRLVLSARSQLAPERARAVEAHVIETLAPSARAAVRARLEEGSESAVGRDIRRHVSVSQLARYLGITLP